MSGTELGTTEPNATRVDPSVSWISSEASGFPTQSPVRSSPSSAEIAASPSNRPSSAVPSFDVESRSATGRPRASIAVSSALVRGRASTRIEARAAGLPSDRSTRTTTGGEGSSSIRPRCGGVPTGHQERPCDGSWRTRSEEGGGSSCLDQANASLPSPSERASRVSARRSAHCSWSRSSSTSRLEAGSRIQSASTSGRTFPLVEERVAVKPKRSRGSRSLPDSVGDVSSVVDAGCGAWTVRGAVRPASSSESVVLAGISEGLRVLDSTRYVEPATRATIVARIKPRAWTRLIGWRLRGFPAWCGGNGSGALESTSLESGTCDGLQSKNGEYKDRESEREPRAPCL